jgi:hypothetical protein
MKNKILCVFFLCLSLSGLAQNKSWYYVAGLTGVSAILYNDFAKEVSFLFQSLS